MITKHCLLKNRHDQQPSQSLHGTHPKTMKLITKDERRYTVPVKETFPSQFIDRKK